MWCGWWRDEEEEKERERKREGAVAVLMIVEWRSRGKWGPHRRERGGGNRHDRRNRGPLHSAAPAMYTTNANMQCRRFIILLASNLI